MEKKRCTKCCKVKLLADFPIRSGERRSSWCKVCHRSYTKQHYADNLDYYKAKSKKRTTRIRQEARDYIEGYLSDHPCVDCGEPEIVLLDFDHKKRASKVMAVARMVSNGLSLETIKKEIAKCDVRCVRCHRLRTATQFGWKKGAYPNGKGAGSRPQSV